jgi:hypothetical protein
MGNSETTNLVDLYNDLSAQLKRLNDVTLTGDKLTEEMNRSVRLKGIADSMINTASVCLKAAEFMADTVGHVQAPPMLELPDSNVKPRKPLALEK